MNDQKIIYTDNNFPKILLTIIGILFFINVYTVFTGVYYAMFAVILQGSIAITIYNRHRSQILLIKVWSAMVFLYGIAGFVQMISNVLRNYLNDVDALNEGLQLIHIFYAIVAVAVGYYYFTEVSTKIKIDEQTITAGKSVAKRDTATPPSS